MSDELLTEAQYEHFGLSKRDGDSFTTWMFSRLGYVLSAKGTGGSGVFVWTRDGALALLTARHVVLHAIGSGQLTIATRVGRRAQSVVPHSIDFSASCDAALLFAPDGFALPEALTPDEWSPSTGIEPDVHTRAVAVGLPGAFKGIPDVANRVIEGAREFAVWTELGGVRVVDDLIESKADTTLEGMPATLKGMSGGPLFTIDRRLLGIHHGEDIPKALLLSTPRGRWTDLFGDLVDKDIPIDLAHEEVRYLHRRSGSGEVAFEFGGVVAWSCSDIDDGNRYNDFGLVSSVTIHATDAIRRHPINLEVEFFFSRNCGKEERERMFEEECRLLIERMFTRPRDEG